jgi:hypothetical protein
MFNGSSGGKKDYSQVSLDDFSDDDDSDTENGDYVQRSIRNQQVRNGSKWNSV